MYGVRGRFVGKRGVGNRFTSLYVIQIVSSGLIVTGRCYCYVSFLLCTNVVNMTE